MEHRPGAVRGPRLGACRRRGRRQSRGGGFRPGPDRPSGACQPGHRLWVPRGRLLPRRQGHRRPTGDGRRISGRLRPRLLPGVRRASAADRPGAGAEYRARCCGLRPHPRLRARAGLRARRRTPRRARPGRPARIGFVRQGKPFYVNGPRDDARKIVRTLERTCGAGNYHYVLGTGPL